MAKIMLSVLSFWFVWSSLSRDVIVERGSRYGTAVPYLSSALIHGTYETTLQAALHLVLRRMFPDLCFTQQHYESFLVRRFLAYNLFYDSINADVNVRDISIANFRFKLLIQVTAINLARKQRLVHFLFSSTQSAET